MLSAHTAASVRAAEQPFLEAGCGASLMRQAAYGLAMGVVAMLRARGRGVYGARAVLLIGSGNNGGDALYAGALLAARGVRTAALLAGARTHPEALAAFLGAGGRCIAEVDAAQPALWAEVSAADVVVDGLLGTGGRGGLRGAAAGIVARLQELEGSARPAVVACDLPSGVDATTGAVHGPVLRADLTITFGAHKAGLLSAPGEQFAGTVKLIDLGITEALADAALFRLEISELAAMLPQPKSADHKYTRGVAGIVAGSSQYPGAGLLAVAAASACGPGMVRYLGPAAVAAAVHLRNPEVVCSDASPGEARVQAWLVGPGINGDDAQRERALSAIASGLPTVVDAGALALVNPAQGTENAHLILTPHAGELAEILARANLDLDRTQIEAEPLTAARRAAEVFGAVVLLKGPTTLIAAPDGVVFTAANGSARLATAGSGDTLAGIIVALLAMLVPAPAIRTLDIPAPEGPRSAAEPRELARIAALAAALHGELASMNPTAPLNAGELAQRIPTVWAQLCHKGS
ncbi:NAD(P)H-hydrate dehydratase [Arthrobacter sp. lap29]|uniref:NAD(P)H-hydrate dehydratase n=1 Tax=Arthrobacter sp. lap29 TaxID=3056122 RepID=UPI0028F74666|nr:NAD(P)H-hydrate dehydratase [Arthrobacter sp. lap29]